MVSAIPAFTDTHATVLRTFLSAPQRPKGAMTYPQLAGFLFSMANAPELIPPSEWLPIAFNDQDARYETRSEAEEVIQAIMALYNDCGQEGMKRYASLPPGCEFRPQPLDNLGDDAPVSQWAHGFMAGHVYLDDIWNEYAPDEFDEELGAILMVLTFFLPRRLRTPTTRRAMGRRAWKTLPKPLSGFFPMR